MATKMVTFKLSLELSHTIGTFALGNNKFDFIFPVFDHASLFFSIFYRWHFER